MKQNHTAIEGPSSPYIMTKMDSGRHRYFDHMADKTGKRLGLGVKIAKHQQISIPTKGPNKYCSVWDALALRDVDQANKEAIEEAKRIRSEKERMR